MTEETEKQSSIKLSKNSKGYTWDIKIYFDDGKDKYADDVLSQIRQINDKLKNEYGKEE